MKNEETIKTSLSLKMKVFNINDEERLRSLSKMRDLVKQNLSVDLNIDQHDLEEFYESYQQLKTIDDFENSKTSLKINIKLNKSDSIIINLPLQNLLLNEFHERIGVPYFNKKINH